jgi:DNA-binding transcriptional ArsR family regulator
MLNQQPDLDLMFQALGDPTRRAIIERLGRGPASVSELAAPLPMSLPGVVQHVKRLEQSGLVTTRKVGRIRTCSIDPVALGLVESWIGDCRSEKAKM